MKKNRSKKFINLSDDDWRSIVDFIEENLMPRIVYYENFLFEFPERIYLTGPESESTKNKSYKDIIEDIVQDIIPGGNIQTSLADVYMDNDTSSRDIFDARQTKLQEKIGKEVFSSWGKLFNTNELQAKASIQLRFGIEQNEKDNNFYVEIKIKENSDLFSISERSLGFRWFFSFLFFILFLNSAAL